MTTPETEGQPTKSKAIIIIAIALGAITIVALTVFAVFFFNAPDTTTDPETGQEQGKPVPTELVPLAENFTVTQRIPGGLEADYSFDVPAIENALILEYRLEDNQFSVLDSGSTTDPGTKTKAILLKNTTDSVSLMFRVVSGKDASEWVNVGSVDVDVTVGNATQEREVNPAYFDTPWALKQDITVAALQEAFIVAFNAPPVQEDEYANCYLGNTASLLPGEIVRPRPDMGTQYELKTYVMQTGNSFKVDFIWCEPS